MVNGDPMTVTRCQHCGAPTESGRFTFDALGQDAEMRDRLHRIWSAERAQLVAALRWSYPLAMAWIDHQPNLYPGMIAAMARAKDLLDQATLRGE